MEKKENSKECKKIDIERQGKEGKKEGRQREGEKNKGKRDRRRQWQRSDKFQK